MTYLPLDPSVCYISRLPQGSVSVPGSSQQGNYKGIGATGRVSERVLQCSNGVPLSKWVYLKDPPFYPLKMQILPLII